MGIKKIREDKGLSQQGLADEIGVKRSTVAMWETGQALPRPDKLLKMAQMFGCSIEDLMKKEE